jgi:DNA modification methylase
MSLPKPYYQDSAVTLYHGDCREIVPLLGRFDLLLTDPPYGIGESSKAIASRQRKDGGASKALADQRDYGHFDWDQSQPDKTLMAIIRIPCKKQIIWGGNYFELPPCKGPLVWDKENGDNDFADGELAWNNLGCALRIKRHMWNGMLRKGGETREHPTQKPLDVIAWCLSIAGDDAKTVLDPFAGSGTTGRACKDLGRKCVMIEREERYCEIAARRMAQEVFTFPTEPTP